MRCMLAAVLVMGMLLGSVANALAERNWEFSFGAFGGLALHGDTTYQTNVLENISTGMVEPVNAKEPIYGLKTRQPLGRKFLRGIWGQKDTIGNRKSDLKLSGPGLPQMFQWAR